MDEELKLDIDEYIDEDDKETILQKLEKKYGKSEEEESEEDESLEEEEDNSSSEEVESIDEEEVYETSNRHKKKRETQNERLKRINRQLQEENARLKSTTFQENQVLFEQKKQAELENLEQQSELLRLKREQYQMIAEEAQSTNNPVSIKAIAELTKTDRELEKIEEELERKRNSSYTRTPETETNNNLPDEFVEAQEKFIKKHKYLQSDPDAQEIATQIANKLNRKYNVSGEDDLIGSPKYMQELDRLLSKKIAEDLEINFSGKKTVKRSYTAPVKTAISNSGQPILSQADKKYLQSIVNLVGEEQAEIVKKSFMAAKKKQLQERND